MLHPRLSATLAIHHQNHWRRFSNSIAIDSLPHSSIRHPQLSATFDYPPAFVWCRWWRIIESGLYNAVDAVTTHKTPAWLSVLSLLETIQYQSTSIHRIYATENRSLHLPVSAVLAFTKYFSFSLLRRSFLTIFHRSIRDPPLNISTSFSTNIGSHAGSSYWHLASFIQHFSEIEQSDLSILCSCTTTRISRIQPDRLVPSDLGDYSNSETGLMSISHRPRAWNFFSCDWPSPTHPNLAICSVKKFYISVLKNQNYLYIFRIFTSEVGVHFTHLVIPVSF